MLFYISFFIIFFVLLCLSEKVKRDQSKFIVFILFCFLIMLAGARGMVGSDTPNYLRSYWAISESPIFTVKYGTVEPIFYGLTVFHAKVFASSWGYLLFLSALQGFILLSIYLRMGRGRIFFFICYFLIFYLNFHFNTLRVGFAALLVLCALQCQDKKFSLLFFFSALGFHLTAAIAFPLVMIKFGKRAVAHSLIFLVLLFCFLYFYSDNIYGKILVYSDYLSENSSGVSTISVVNSFIVVFSFVIFKKLSAGYLVSGIILVFCLIMYNFYPIFYRLIFLSNLFYVFYLASEVGLRKSRSLIRIFSGLVLVVHGFLSVHGIYMEKEKLLKRASSGDLVAQRALESTYIPYQFYWHKPYN